MLLGMPLASTMGLLGSPKKPMVLPWLLNRNGQSITLARTYKGRVQDDPKALKPVADEAKAKGTPLTFAMTFPPGTHAMWTRYYLGAGGIHPDRDVALVTIPPAQMVSKPFGRDMPDGPGRQHGAVRGGQPGFAQRPARGFADLLQDDAEGGGQAFALVQRQRQGLQESRFVHGRRRFHSCSRSSN